VKYVDPDGREAWKPTTTWNQAMEGTFRDKFSQNAIKIANNATRNHETIDCADVAFTALIDTAQEMGLKITFDYYVSSNDPSKRGYQTISSSDSRFKNKGEFLSFVKNNMGSLTLIDHRTTKYTAKITRGDLVMFDLRVSNDSRYRGHTIIVTGIHDSRNYKVNSVQGHIEGRLPTIEVYTLGDTIDGVQPQYKSFRFDRLFR
jgi:hypothetical protein